MKEISIEELKRVVGPWVKLAPRQEPITITDDGKPVATLTRIKPPHYPKRLPDREAKIRRRSQITVDSD